MSRSIPYSFHFLKPCFLFTSLVMKCRYFPPTDKLVDCEAEGWGSSCITRVLKYTSTGNEIWLRSCVSPPPMTCDPGLDDSGAAGPVWTHCCDDDHCNDVDPRDELPTTTEVANTDGRMTLDIISGSLKL